MKSSRLELSINMVIDRFIFENNPIMVFFCFFSYSKQVSDYQKGDYFLRCRTHESLKERFTTNSAQYIEQ